MAEAKIRVTLELLCAALQLPTGTIIHDVDGFRLDGYAELTLSHPDIPSRSPIGGGTWPPMASPTFRKQPEVVFVDWNVEKE